MATRFAVVSGNWSSGATWDNGNVPTTSDDVYSNGFNIAVDQNIDAVSLRSTVSNVYLPNMSIPLMTSNSTPSGTAIASLDIANAYKVFDQDSTTTWQNTSNLGGWVGYQFPSPVIIKRYYYTSVGNFTLKFQASNDNFATWVDLENVTTAQSSYVSGILTGTTGFTYYRLNIGSVNFGNAPSVRTLEMTELTGITYGSSAGGSFNVSVPRDITLSGAPALYTGNGSTGTINITALSGTVNIIANNGLTNLNVGAGRCIYVNGTATVNVIGSCNHGTTATATVIKTNSTGIINYTGDTTNGASGSGSSSLFDISSMCTFNIRGNINGHQSATGTIAHYNVNISANANVNIMGKLTGYLGYSLNNIANSIINISGTVITNSTAAAINNGGIGSIFINGPISASTSSNAIISSSTGLLTITGPVINNSNVMGIAANKVRFVSGQTAQWTVQDTTNANVTLSSISSSGITIGLPLSGDVRYLTTYGQNNEYVGSLRVPSLDNVRKGVPTDYTVGTADLTANDIFSAISGSSNSVAVRLRNVSTVQSAGDQIASLS